MIDFCTLICFLEVFEHVLLPWLLKASSDFVSPSRTLHFGDTLGTIFVQDFCSLVVSLSLDAEFSCDIRLCFMSWSSWLSGMKLGQMFCSIFCKSKYLDLMSAYLLRRLSVLRYCRESYHEIVTFQPCTTKIPIARHCNDTVPTVPRPLRDVSVSLGLIIFCL